MVYNELNEAREPRAITKGIKTMDNIIDINDNNNNMVTTSINHYERFLDFIDVKPETERTYRKGIKQFVIYMNNNEITEPTRDDVINYRESLKEGHKPSTVQVYLAALKAFYKWAEVEGVGTDIAKNVKGMKIETQHKKDSLTTHQTQTLLNSIDRKSDKGKRDYAIILLMVTGGLRDIEVSRSDMQDLRIVGDSTVLFIQGKGKDTKDIYIKVSNATENAIREYISTLDNIDDKSPLFTSLSGNSKGNRLTTRSISRVVKEAFKKVGLVSERLTAHSLRHTTATLNLLNGGSLEETQELLRHSNINTTMIYLHHMSREKNQSEQRIEDAIFKM